jgi:hypothetical protein
MDVAFYFGVKELLEQLQLLLENGDAGEDLLAGHAATFLPVRAPTR